MPLQSPMKSFLQAFHNVVHLRTAGQFTPKIWIFRKQMSRAIKNWSIQALPGISDKEVNLLRDVGIQTTRDLLTVARSPQTLQAAAQKLGLSLRYLQKWAALAELAQLPSVGCQYCGLLLHSGITSIQQLSATAPGRLHSQIRRLHTMTMKRSDLCPTADQVVLWVQEATVMKAK